MSKIVDKVKDKMEGGGSSGGGLKQGSKLPNVGLLKENSIEKGEVDLTTLKGKNLLVAVPGAFSPGCSNQVPGYVENAEKFAAKGIEGIYIVAMNDGFVMQAWKEKLGAKGNPMLHFIADDEGKFTKSAGMSFDATGFFGTHRSQRYAALINNGVVEKIFVQDDPTQITVSSAENLLEAI